jgi:protein MpaA
MSTKNQITSCIRSLRATSRSITNRLPSLPTRLSTKYLLITGGTILLLFVLGYTISFYMPRTVLFSYAGNSCFTNPTIFPTTATKTANTAYRIEPQVTLAVLGNPVYAQVSCVIALRAPQESTRQNIIFGTSSFHKTVSVVAAKQPVLRDTAQLHKLVPTKDTLSLELTQPDDTFSYQLSADGRHVLCTTKNKELRCDVAKLNLQQSTSYTFTVERLFKGTIAGTVLHKTLMTVDAVHVINTSIAAGTVAYNIPADLVLTLDKPIKSAKNVKLQQIAGSTQTNIPASVQTQGNTVAVHFTQALPRSANFTLTIEDVTSPEGGYLLEPYALFFSTSGGPKVGRINIGSSRIAASTSMTLTFDTTISATQSVASFVRVEANGTVVPATTTTSGNTVTIKPSASLPRCANVVVKVLDGIQNEFGVAGGSAWQFKSRVLCQTSFSIGSSVNGRAIMAYSFGTGASKIIFVGGTHGNERSSVYILNRWIDYLEGNPSSIPANRTIIIIPVVNPDGYATNSRTNAHNVDLNRNFPSNSWKSGVTMPDHSYLEYGGGTAPLSEPEWLALQTFVLAQRPRVVLTYHGAGGVVVPNDSGDSDAIARTYGAKSSVGYMGNSGTPTFFEYDTTGAFEDWLHDKHGIPALLIELLEKNANEFSGHQNALLYITNLKP